MVALCASRPATLPPQPIPSPPLRPQSSSSHHRPQIPLHEEAAALTQSPALARLSLPRLLKACARSHALSPGRQLHALSVKLRLSSDPFVQTSLLSLYSSCARLPLALRLFDQMPHRNVVAWTAALDACLRSGQPRAAASTFRRMLESGVAPDAFALVGALSACAALGGLALGRAVHAHVEKKGGELTAVVATALVDMYCKCGGVGDAAAVFDSVPATARATEAWNAMLHGLAVHGRGAEAVRLFGEMAASGGVRPNGVTFVGLLCGCAHAGLLREGRLYFEAMAAEYGVERTVKHYGCMVDLLGRAGLLDEAFGMVCRMPVPPNHVIWGALLGACRAHGDLNMAERVMERMVEEDCPVEDTSRFVIMSNMYRKAGLSEQLRKARIMVGKKPKSRSWIEVGGQVHEFEAGGDSFD